MRYVVLHYTDVIKNDEGQWAVNKLEKTDVIIYVDSDTKPRDICKILADAKILSTSDMRKIQISDLTSSIIEVKEKKGMVPICRLERSNVIA